MYVDNIQDKKFLFRMFHSYLVISKMRQFMYDIDMRLFSVDFVNLYSKHGFEPFTCVICFFELNQSCLHATS